MWKATIELVLWRWREDETDERRWARRIPRKEVQKEQWSRIELSVQNDSKFSMAESMKICSDE